MMNRREFAQHLALLAAGAAALPTQVDAFERLYEVNSRPFGEAVSDLIKIEDVFVGGTSNCSKRVTIQILEGERLLTHLGFNAFGGVIRWVPTPSQPVFATYKGLRIVLTSPEFLMPGDIEGSIHYIDLDGRLQVERITHDGARFAQEKH